MPGEDFTAVPSQRWWELAERQQAQGWVIIALVSVMILLVWTLISRGSFLRGRTCSRSRGPMAEAAPGPAVAVAEGASAPSVDEQAAGQASAAAGASAVLAGQAQGAAEQASAAAQVAAEGAMVAEGAGEAASAAQAAASEAAASRSAVEQFILSQVAVNEALAAAVAAQSAPPPPAPAPEPAKRDAPPRRSEHFLERRVGRR